MRLRPGILLMLALPAFAALGQTTEVPVPPAAALPPAALPLTTQPAASPPRPAQADLPPADTREEAVLGVAEFRLLGSGFRDAYLGRNLARLLSEKLAEIKTHYINEAERYPYAAGLIAEERRKILKDIDGILGRRDALFFPGLVLPQRGKRDELSENLETAREKLGRLDGLSPSGIAIVREKRLLPPEAVNEGETLLPPVLSPAEAAKRAKADYLLYGTIEEAAAGYFTATAYLYGAGAGMTLYSARASGSYEETDRVAEELFLNMASPVAGRSWAVLEITAEPKEAGIFADGNLIGIGKAKLAYVPPGSYRILVRSGGYESREETVEIGPSAREKRSYSLAPIDSELILIESIPSEADMYLGALRVGRTPLSLPKDRPPQVGRLEAEGRKSKIFAFPPASGGDPGFHILPRDVVSWKERIESKRRGFYGAFGWFVLSLPAPILLYGLYQNEVFGYLQYTSAIPADPDTARGMEERANILLYSYYGTLFVSGALLVNAAQKLFDYIRTGEESQRYPEGSRKD